MAMSRADADSGTDVQRCHRVPRHASFHGGRAISFLARNYFMKRRWHMHERHSSLSIGLGFAMMPLEATSLLAMITFFTIHGTEYALSWRYHDVS